VKTEDLLGVTNPYDGSLVARVHRAGPEELARAMGAAVDAAPKVAAQPTHERMALLGRIADGLKQRQVEFVEAIVREAGKPRRYAEAEVQRGLMTLGYAYQEAGNLGGEAIPLGSSPAGAGLTAFVRRIPVGPAIGISPFNFPLNLMLHKIAPAIAAGCPIIHKPASAVPATALLFADVVNTAGALPGQVQILPMAAATMDPLIADARFKALSFTGSPEVGWDLKARAGRKKVTLELGGNAAAVLEPDADIDRALEDCLEAAFAYAGQVCISLQRLYIHEELYDALIPRLIKAVQQIPHGDPSDPRTVVGPLITNANAERIQAWVQEATSAGATLLAGGGRERQVLEPMLLEGVPPTVELGGTEAFGPVLLVERYRDFDEVLFRVNSTRYGLQHSVYTASLPKAMKALEIIEAGGVLINLPPTFRVDSMPYGGVKESGFGREGVRYAIEELYTEPRLCVINV
ncbi:MAG TPA: aldehyde dehydrogenase family protein, partial [bacterium]|nr:aldehyde dehydrogenase family protein [bacterium]